MVLPIVKYFLRNLQLENNVTFRQQSVHIAWEESDFTHLQVLGPPFVDSLTEMKEQRELVKERERQIHHGNGLLGKA